jgi:hypothetical protein
MRKSLPNPLRAYQTDAFADVAFVVDEAYQSKALLVVLFELLIRHAPEEVIKGFTADVRRPTNDAEGF